MLKVTTWVRHSIDSHPVLEIPTGPPVRGRQLWRGTWNFLLIFLQFYVYDLRFKAWGPTTFFTEFQTLLTSLSFHVNWTSHSWDTAFSKFDPENPRSRSWVRWTLKVTTWVQHSIDSHPFNSISICHPIPEIGLFQNLTLKIQGQGHGWGERWKSQSGCNILSTHIPFVPCQSGIPFLSYDFFLNLTLKIKGQGHEWSHSSKSQVSGSNILSIHIPFVPCQSALPFLRYSIFKIWPWKSKVKVKWPWCCTTTGLDNSIELRMV